MPAARILTSHCRLGLALVVAIALGACSSRDSGEDQIIREISPPSVVSSLDPVSTSLLAAAERTSTALDRLSLVEQTRTPVPDPGRVNAIPPGLDRKANIDWNGPLAPLVARVAAEAGYEFRVVGDAPTIPVVVDITRDNEDLVEILRDVGFQATGRALVSVDVAQRRIEVRYAPN